MSTTPLQSSAHSIFGERIVDPQPRSITYRLLPVGQEKGAAREGEGREGPEWQDEGDGENTTTPIVWHNPDRTLEECAYCAAQYRSTSQIGLDANPNPRVV